MTPPRFFLAIAAALALLLGSAPALSQPAERSIRYTVRKGDTLLALGARFLMRAQDYQTIQQLNRIPDPYRLPVGAVLVIPERLLRVEPSFGRIASFRGAVNIDGRPAGQGMQIRQGTRIETGANASVTVRFADGSAIALPSQSSVRVDRLRRIPLTDSIDRSFQLDAGRVRSTVTPIRNRNSNFRVTTPLSVSAVRGTDFRVVYNAQAMQARTEVLSGIVGVAPDENSPEVAVSRGFGVIGTPQGIQPPVRLLPAPMLTGIARGADNRIVVTTNPVQGAMGYRTELATDGAFRDVLSEIVTDTPGATFFGVGDIVFFVRLTAIAPSGLEGLSATHPSRRPAVPPAPRPRTGEAAPSDPHQLSMTGHGRIQSAPSDTQPPLR